MMKLFNLVHLMLLGSFLYSQSSGAQFYQSHSLYIKQTIANYRGYCEMARAYNNQFVVTYCGDHSNYWKQHSIDKLADCKEAQISKSRWVYSSDKFRMPSLLRPGSKSYSRIRIDSSGRTAANYNFTNTKFNTISSENQIEQKEKNSKSRTHYEENHGKALNDFSKNSKTEGATKNHVVTSKQKITSVENEIKTTKNIEFVEKTKVHDSRSITNQNEDLNKANALHYRVLFTKSPNPDLSFLSLSPIGPVYSEYNAQSKLYHYYLGHFSSLEEAKQVGASSLAETYKEAQIEKLYLGRLEAVYPISTIENKEMITTAPFIVIGSFIDPKKAEKVLLEIKENGYLSKTELYNGYHRVGLIYEGSSDSLELFLEQIRIKFNKDAWIRK